MMSTTIKQENIFYKFLNTIGVTHNVQSNKRVVSESTVNLKLDSGIPEVTLYRNQSKKETNIGDNKGNKNKQSLPCDCCGGSGCGYCTVTV